MIINKDMKIGEIIRYDMDIVPILMGAGMHCVGCPSAQGETLEQACLVHGNDINELIRQLNEYFADKQNYFAELANNAKSINFNGLITPYDATVKGDFINAVKEEYLDGGASWEDTVEAFKDLVSEHITSLDWDE